MKELQPELRPPEFPEYLWPWVFDSQKCTVQQRFLYDTDLVMSNRTSESEPIDTDKIPRY